MNILPAMCFVCARLRKTAGGSGLVCEAYPEGIPVQIIRGQWDHRVSKPGDRGFQFVPDPSLPPGLTVPQEWWPEEGRPSDDFPEEGHGHRVGG